MFRVCIDARFYGVRDTGIGRYVQNLIANLPNDPNVEVVIIKNARFHPYSILAQFEMVFRLRQIRPDLLHVPHDSPPLLWRGKTVVTIHDLIKLKSTGLVTTTLPAWLYYFKLAAYRVLLRFSLGRAVHIIVPSQYVKNELGQYFGISPGKISVIYEGVDHE